MRNVIHDPDYKLTLEEAKKPLIFLRELFKSRQNNCLVCFSGICQSYFKRKAPAEEPVLN